MKGSNTVTSPKRCVLIERLGEIGSFGQHAAQKDAAKHRPEALCPPFVDVVDRAVDFLPPALTLRELGKELEREGIRFDQVACYSSVGIIVGFDNDRFRLNGPHGDRSVDRPFEPPGRKHVLAARPGFGTFLGISSLVWRSKE